MVNKALEDELQAGVHALAILVRVYPLLSRAAVLERITLGTWNGH